MHAVLRKYLVYMRTHLFAILSYITEFWITLKCLYTWYMYSIGEEIQKKKCRYFLMKHSAHRVRLWWKSSRIFGRISLPSSGQILPKIRQLFHHTLTVCAECFIRNCFQSPKTFTPKMQIYCENMVLVVYFLHDPVHMQPPYIYKSHYKFKRFVKWFCQ